MATGEILTSLPITIVPVRSLTTIRAGRSTSTWTSSTLAINSVIRSFHSGGGVTAIKDEFSAWAIRRGAGNFLLMASAMRDAVAKSELCNWSLTVAEGSTDGAAFSTVAPSGTRPTVG